MFEGFERRAVDLDGIKIVCVVGGSGPPVLLLHGFPQNKAMWTRVAPQLASTFTVVCADLRGYGDSAKPKCLPDRSNYAFRAFANDQISLMRKLGFERFHVVGHDRGGRTAHRMALDYPEAVLTLTVIDKHIAIYILWSIFFYPKFFHFVLTLFIANFAAGRRR